MLSLVLLLALICSAQEAPTFRSDVSLVRVDAEVTDGIKTLNGFRQEDFIVKEKGQSQRILYFSQEQVPLDLILLFDISNSMRPNVQRVAASANTALAELHPGDRIAIMTFHRTSQIVTPFSEDLAAIERTIYEKVIDGKFHGGTRLLAGVDDAAKYFLEQPRSERRRAVLILTDNYGQRSRHGRTVIHRLWEADASLSGLIIRGAAEQAMNTITMAMNPLLLALHEGMEGVADKTGGDTLKADNAGQDFREMMRRIRQRYSLYYAMPEAKRGEERMVKVELSNEALSRYPKARVRAPKGYVVR
jgi:VWFA-related protein